MKMRSSRTNSRFGLRVMAWLLALGGFAASSAEAGTVTLYWHSLDATTSGTLVLQSAGVIADPNNFSLTGNVAALKADILSFTFTNASGTFSSSQPWAFGGASTTLATFAAELLAPTSPLTPAGNWQVSNGVLTSIFAIESGSTMSMSGTGNALFSSGGAGATAALSGNGNFTIAPSGTLSFAGTVAQGYWSTTAVPLPAAAWLLGSGLLGMLGFRRRAPTSLAAA